MPPTGGTPAVVADSPGSRTCSARSQVPHRHRGQGPVHALILAIPREYRHHITAAVDYFTAQLEVELHAEDEARAEKALAAIE